MRLSADRSALFDAQPASAPTENASIQFLLIHGSLQVLVLLTRSICSRLPPSRKQLSILRPGGQWSCSQYSGIEWLQSAVVLRFIIPSCGSHKCWPAHFHLMPELFIWPATYSGNRSAGECERARTIFRCKDCPQSARPPPRSPCCIVCPI